MSNANDPFGRRKASGKLFKQTGSESYQGQRGLESLFGAVAPRILVRTDPRIDCVCQSIGNTGDALCTRCFGTGKVVKSLDRTGMYVSLPTVGIGNSGVMGWEENDIRKIYCGRWVMPSRGDLVLDVGWDCPNDQVYSRGKVQVVHNVYQIKQAEPKGFQQVSYFEIASVSANLRQPYIEDILLFSSALPPWKNCLAP